MYLAGFFSCIFIILRLINSGVVSLFLRFKLANDAAARAHFAALIGKKLVVLLPKLGPAFVKLGQAIATRPDLVGEAVSVELEHLQDRLPSGSFKDVAALLDLRFQQDAFKFIEPQAVAAASVAIVYKAQTWQEDLVAIKVLRPGIKKKFHKNLTLLFAVAKILNLFQSCKRLRLIEVAQTIRETTLMELDLMMEAAAADKLRQNLSKDPGVYVPKVFWEYTSHDILTTEWIEGTPIYDKKKMIECKFDLSAIAGKLAITFFNQAYRDGFFHADVHQGNILVDAQERIVLIDFGIVGQLEYVDKIFVAEILKSFLERDYDKVAKLHFEANYVPRSQSQQAFALACRSIGEPIFNKSLESISISHLLKQLFAITQQFQMKTQPQLLLLQKTMITVEGLIGSLDNRINMWSLIEPWIKKWAEENLGLKAMLFKKINYYQKLYQEKINNSN